MRVEVVVGVPCPEEVDEATVLGVVPYGDCSLTVVQGGLRVPGGCCGNDTQGAIIMASAAVIVSLDVGDYLAFKRAQATHVVAPGDNTIRGAQDSADEILKAEEILAKHFRG
jgi:hypothetical protein